MYASFLGISAALHLDIFHQPHKKLVFRQSQCHHNSYRVERGSICIYFVVRLILWVVGNLVNFRSILIFKPHFFYCG
jgi:hypothetical protein